MVCCARFNVWNACLVSLGYSVMLGKERERTERVCRQKNQFKLLIILFEVNGILPHKFS